ncbi:MAG: heavy metal translocating P-type ATPase, partial [Butyricicoccus sp.]
MKIRIEHEISGRLRFSTSLGRLTIAQADQLQYYLLSLPDVTGVKVYERSGNAVVFYQGSRKRLLRGILAFAVDTPEVQGLVPEHTSRALNHTYYHKILNHIGKYWLYRLVIPRPLRIVKACLQGAQHICMGIRCLLQRKLEVAVLDATAIAVSLVRGQFSTASSIMFLLGLGELMEEWTHKKSVADLASSMSLNVEKVWRRTGETDELVSIREIVPGNYVRVEMGSMIPLDGVVVEGEAMVNQSSMT